MQLIGWNSHTHHSKNGTDRVGADDSLFLRIECIESHFQLCEVENFRKQESNFISYDLKKLDAIKKKIGERA